MKDHLAAVNAAFLKLGRRTRPLRPAQLRRVLAAVRAETLQGRPT